MVFGTRPYSIPLRPGIPDPDLVSRIARTGDWSLIPDGQVAGPFLVIWR
jgi:hypothetical protein